MPNANLNDMKVRNNVTLALVVQLRTASLAPPFHIPPHVMRLSDIKIPETIPPNVYPEGFKLPFVMQNSPDQGAFLVTQPVPKCGAFCYLAIVSRPANK